MTHNHITFIKPSSHKYVQLCTRTFDECTLKNFKFTKKYIFQMNCCRLFLHKCNTEKKLKSYSLSALLVLCFIK